MAPLHIICFGNLLQGDDGFGIHVCAELRAAGLPRDVQVFDAGLLGPGALHHFEGCSTAVVVDALDLRTAAGHLRRFPIEEVSAPQAAFSAHALDVAHLLYVLPILFSGRRRPAVVVVGAEIEVPDGRYSTELSPPLSRAIPAAIALIRVEIAAWRGPCPRRNDDVPRSPRTGSGDLG